MGYERAARQAFLTLRAGTVAVRDVKRFQKSRFLRQFWLNYPKKTAPRRRQFMFLLKVDTQSTQMEAQKLKQQPIDQQASRWPKASL
jgi:hypothetical protein